MGSSRSGSTGRVGSAYAIPQIPHMAAPGLHCGENATGPNGEERKACRVSDAEPRCPLRGFDPSGTGRSWHAYCALRRLRNDDCRPTCLPAITTVVADRVAQRPCLAYWAASVRLLVPGRGRETTRARAVGPGTYPGVPGCTNAYDR